MAINGYRIRYKIGTVVPVFTVALSFGATGGGYRKSMPLIEEQLSCVGEDGPFLHSSGKDTHEQAT